MVSYTHPYIRQYIKLDSFIPALSYSRSGEFSLTNISAAETGVTSPDRKKASGDFQAAYTNNQWYCFQAKQMVFFTAFSTEIPDQERLVGIAKDLVRLAPQLGGGFDGAVAGQELDDETLHQITGIIEVDELDGYPENWDLSGNEMFASPHLPFFRVRAVVRRSGPDKSGRAAMIMMLSTHALLEGADGALMSRSKSVERDIETIKPRDLSKIGKLGYSAIAALLVPLQLLAAQLLVPKKTDAHYRALCVERERLKRIATKLDISQRSLIFSLSTFVLNDGGKGFSAKTISAMYADLDGASQFQTNDDFFRFRMVALKLKVADDFFEYTRNVDKALKDTETNDVTATQSLLNAMFAMHRRAKRHLPFLYTGKTFRFSAGYHLTLSLLPPQRLFGRTTKGMREPIYAGTFHPGMNMCVFAPGRTKVTFCFSLNEKLAAKVDKMMALLDEIDAKLF